MKKVYNEYAIIYFLVPKTGTAAIITGVAKFEGNTVFSTGTI